MGNIISSTNLTKEFNSVIAVKNANIEIKKGCFYGIMGRSGAGKTTLLSLLGLLENPTSGNLYVNGKDTSNMKENEKALIRMRDLGFVFQDFYLNPILKASENVKIPMYINPNIQDENINNRAKELLCLLGLQDRINHYPSQLSGGEKQRVAIARALANNPSCIFADEPTGNLDEKNEKVILDYLKALVKQGKSVVVVSHNAIILEYADYIFEMNDGVLEGNYHGK